MQNITLYSTHCPMCMKLIQRLNEAKITYTENDDVIAMTAKGITAVPTLEVDGQLLNFQQAWAWATEVKNGNQG